MLVAHAGIMTTPSLFWKTGNASRSVHPVYLGRSGHPGSQFTPAPYRGTALVASLPIQDLVDSVEDDGRPAEVVLADLDPERVDQPGAEALIENGVEVRRSWRLSTRRVGQSTAH